MPTPLSSKLLLGYSFSLEILNSTIELLSILLPELQILLGALKTYPWMLTGSRSLPLAYEVKGLNIIVCVGGMGSSLEDNPARDL